MTRTQEPGDTLVDGATIDVDSPADAPFEGVVVLLSHRDGLSTLRLAEGEERVIGRDEPADIRPRSRRLSRRHARLWVCGGALFVEDLGSTNGTWMGERRLVGAVRVAPGEVVRMGSATVSLRPAAVRHAAPSDAGPLVVHPAMRRIFETVARVGPSLLSVLVVGETGTGKELVAKALHAASPRSSKPLRAINCGALPANLVESTLFGYERGAFTGADQRRSGVFEEANGGTVFLDEIGELSAAAQAALLRVLEARAVQRVGSTVEVPVDVRVVAATHQDLEAMAQRGAFRLDLLYRLNSVTLHIPPLRDRLQELEPLVERFVREANLQNQREVLGVSPEAWQALKAHGWPGNVRELRNAIERAVVVAHGAWITREDLPDRLVGAWVRPEVTPDLSPARVGAAAAPIDLKAHVERFEQLCIATALSETGGNRSRAAALLGIPRRTLVYKLAGMPPRSDWPDPEPEVLAAGPSSFRERVRAHTLGLARAALREAGGDPARAAQLLSIQKRTLLTWIDEEPTSLLGGAEPRG